MKWAERDKCMHLKVVPEFDEEVAKTLTAKAARALYPRFAGKCPDCDYVGVLYASMEHYIYGDY